MKIKINSKKYILSFFFFILTLAGSQFFSSRGLDSLLEYLCFGLLLISLAFHYYHLGRTYRIKYIIVPSMTVLLCLCIGLFLNDITWLRRFILFGTVFAIWACIFWGEAFLNSVRYLKSISYAVLLGVFISLILGITDGAKIISTNEGLLGYTYGFTGGINFKNYFAADMLVVFIGLYLYGRDIKRRSIDMFFMAFSFIAICLSGSRGGLVLFLIFFVCINSDKIKKIDRNQRRIFFGIILAAGIIVFVILYQRIALNSDTYMYRIRGLQNYWNYYLDDQFHLFFGNSENTYDQKLSYVFAVRTIVGWDGSLEFSWLDIIIKSGLLGVLGYMIVFFRYGFLVKKNNDWKIKSILFAVLATLLASSLVEAYIQSVHSLLGIYSYLVMSGLAGEYRKYEHNKNSKRIERMAGI